MSRMEKFDVGITVERASDEFANDPDIQLWLKMGRIATYFCLWMAMALPVLLVIAVRF
ncbi:MAG: hypothetical protein AAF376_18110 [Pseudomonadota bacterium]